MLRFLTVDLDSVCRKAPKGQILRSFGCNMVGTKEFSRLYHSNVFAPTAPLETLGFVDAFGSLLEGLAEVSEGCWDMPGTCFVRCLEF